MSGSIRRFAVACAAIVAAAGLVGEAGSGAYALAPVRLSTAGADVEASRPHVALDSRGDAFAVWTESVHSGMTTMAAIRPAGGSWPVAVRLAAGGYAQLAVNRRGDAVVAGLVFGKTTRIFAVYRRAGHGFGPARRISGPVAGPVDRLGLGRDRQRRPRPDRLERRHEGAGGDERRRRTLVAARPRRGRRSRGGDGPGRRRARSLARPGRCRRWLRRRLAASRAARSGRRR